MQSIRPRLFFLCLLPVLLQDTGPARAIPADTPPPDVLAFDRFVSMSGPVCEHRPAPECVDLGFAFADADGDRRLSIAELESVHEMLEAWTEWRQPELSAFEVRTIGIGLWLTRSLGVGALHALYDENGDGLLSRSELLADVALDERPLGEVLLDPEAVDRRAIAQRLGALAPLLDHALP